MEKKNMRIVILMVLEIIFFLTGCSTAISKKKLALTPVKDDLERIELGRGINIGNALDAPKGKNWGVKMKTEYFDVIKEAGFDTVRLPVRFSAYSDKDDYKLEEDFMKEIDEYIDYALTIKLNVVLDLHHFVGFTQRPEAEIDRFLSIWQQLSERYKEYPNELVFEVLNEPQNELGGELWNSYIERVVGLIRKTNPHRLIIIGGEYYNSIQGLEALVLPEDENIIVTFHYYLPNEFTFQGDPYHAGYEHLKDIKWTASPDEVAHIRNDFQKVKTWAEENHVKVFLGEFGVLKTVPFAYRGLWTQTVIDLAEEMNFSWCYWELCSRFGVYDADASQWDMDMLQVLQKR